MKQYKSKKTKGLIDQAKSFSCTLGQSVATSLTSASKIFFALISSDLTRSNHLDVKNNIVDRFTVTVHNFNFAVLVIFSIVYFTNVTSFDEMVVSALQRLLHVDAAKFDTITPDPIKIFHLFSTMLVFVTGIPLATYFFIRYGDSVNRVDFVRMKVINIFISNILLTIGSMIGFVIFFVAAYLVAIKFPEFTHLNQLHGFFVVQTIVIIKLQSLAATCSSTFFQLLLPYQLFHRLFNR